MAMAAQAFGVIGLEVMGRNIALNIERNGFPIAVFNRTFSKTQAFLEGPAKGKNAKGVTAFYDWAFNKGDASAQALGYVPLPAAVKDLVRKEWAANGMAPAAK